MPSSAPRKKAAVIPPVALTPMLASTAQDPPSVATNESSAQLGMQMFRDAFLATTKTAANPGRAQMPVSDPFLSRAEAPSFGGSVAKRPRLLSQPPAPLVALQPPFQGLLEAATRTNAQRTAGTARSLMDSLQGDHHMAEGAASEQEHAVRGVAAKAAEGRINHALQHLASQTLRSDDQIARPAIVNDIAHQGQGEPAPLRRDAF